MNSKDAAREKIEQNRKPLVDLSHRIHAHPELGFEEEKACGWLCEMLDGAGFKVERGICDLPTAFTASAGAGPPSTIACRRSATPAATTSSPRWRRARESRSPKLLTTPA